MKNKTKTKETEMYCSKCGRVDDTYTAYCVKCGRVNHLIREVHSQQDIKQKVDSSTHAFAKDNSKGVSDETKQSVDNPADKTQQEIEKSNLSTKKDIIGNSPEISRANTQQEIEKEIEDLNKERIELSKKGLVSVEHNRKIAKEIGKLEGYNLAKQEAEAKQKEFIEKFVGDNLERIADLEHKRWSHWMRYMFSLWDFEINAPECFKEDIKRWKRQMKQEYKELSEKEKNSDRDFARFILEELEDKLSSEVFGGGNGK